MTLLRETFPDIFLDYNVVDKSDYSFQSGNNKIIIMIIIIIIKGSLRPEWFIHSQLLDICIQVDSIIILVITYINNNSFKHLKTKLLIQLVIIFSLLFLKVFIIIITIISLLSSLLLFYFSKESTKIILAWLITA